MADVPPPAPPGGAETPGVLGGWQPSVLATLRAERLTCAAVFAVLLGAGAVFSALLVPQYRAELLVMVEPQQARLVEQSTVLDPLRVDMEMLQTEAELIQSPGTLEAVADKLRLQDDAEFGGTAPDRPGPLATLRPMIADLLFALTGYPPRPAASLLPAVPPDVPVSSMAALRLARHVTASPVGKTYLIAIAASSADPVKAAIIANSVAEHYIAARNASRIDMSAAASAAIRSRLAELGEKLRQGEMALADFKAKSGLVETLSASGVSAPILQHELSDAAAQRAEATSRELLLASRLGQLSGRNAGAASAEALASPMLQQLREREAALAAELARASARLGPNHPTARENERALGAVRAAIAAALDDVRRSVAGELAGTKERERLLEARLATLRARMSTEATEEAQLATLQADVASSRTMYEAFLARFKATAEQPHLEQPVAAIVSAARVPQLAYSPRLALVVPGFLGVSMFGAAAAGVLRAALRRGYRSAARLAAELGLREVVALPAPRPGAAAPAAPFAEALSKLTFILSAAASGTVVLVTSLAADDGKTQLSAALAAQTQARGQRTLLVDCDVTRPALRGEARPGLSECCAGAAGWDECVVAQRHGDADGLPRGSRLADPTSALASPMLATILAGLRACYDLVILEGPPVLQTPGIRYLAAQADQTVLVVRFATTRRDAVRAAAAELALAGARLDVAVLTFAGSGSGRQTLPDRSAGLAASWRARHAEL